MAYILWNHAQTKSLDVNTPMDCFDKRAKLKYGGPGRNKKRWGLLRRYQRDGIVAVGMLLIPNKSHCVVDCHVYFMFVVFFPHEGHTKTVHLACQR